MARKPEPVAICRLKRVAADHKSDGIKERMPAIAPRNGKRVACVGAGPASLTVARDLAPLGYEVTVFDGEAKAGGFIRSQIPRFRLPESVIDEETGYILDMGVQFRSGQRVDSLRALLQQGYDAVFVGSGAPRGRDLEIPGRSDITGNIHIGIDWLASVSFGHITSIAPRVIVLGGGNTAMDCCRSARRLGGTDVKVIVRSGFEEMKASPWEKEDALHEGIPILNFHVPKAFEHENGQLTAMTFEMVQAEYDAQGRRSLVPTGEPDVRVPCDVVLIAVGQENAFPWIEDDLGIAFDRWGLPQLHARHLSVHAAAAVLWWRRGLRPQEHHHCRGAGARGGGVDRPLPAWRRRAPAPGAAHQPDVHQDGHPRVELRQRRLQRPALQSAVGQGRGGAGQHPGGSGAGL